MTSLAVAASSYQGIALRRGAGQRKSNWEEQFQIGIVHSIAAAAGCEFWSTPIDDGIDCGVKRRFNGSVDSAIELQLKAVSNSNRWNAARTEIAAILGRSRYEVARIPLSEHPVERRIIVIMDQPSAVDDWLACQHNIFQIKNACYWVSLEGSPKLKPSQQTATVHAPVAHVFDDAALCAIMEKVNRGLPL